MKEFLMKMVPVAASDRFPFQCRRCGACCHHVRQSVPLETLDAFRLASIIRILQNGQTISLMAEKWHRNGSVDADDREKEI